MGEGRRRAGLAATAAAAGAVAWRAHQAAIERVRAAVRREREWSRRLTGELQALQKRVGPMGESQDVRDLVLRTAMGLLGASKGVLLSRMDADADGDLDLVFAHGFDGDPEHRPVVQRFASRVLERDEMVVEDHVEDDSEIDNLVAVPVYMYERFSGVVICANRRGGFGKVDENVLLALGDHAGAALHSQRLHHELRDTHRGAVRMLGAIVAAADPDISAAAVEGATLAAALARRLELEPTVRDMVVCAAALRDVGLLAVPEAILAKAGPLSPAERAVVQRHAQVGFEAIGHVPALRDVAFGVLYHHERHDGTGYPAGLAGDAIPLAARVVAVVDAFCAITRERPYRPARAAAEALRELIDNAGTQLDPELVALMVEEIEDPQLRSVDAGTVEAAMEWLLLPERLGPIAGDGLASATDGLTRLGAHSAFREDAATAAREGGPFAVVLVEPADLRGVNEREGYAAGDRLLTTAARRLQRVASRAGVVAYRDGGGRFGVVARGHDAVAARRLLDEINAEFSLGPAVRVGVAVGEPGQSGDAAIAAARRELRGAVAAGLADLDKVE